MKVINCQDLETKSVTDIIYNKEYIFRRNEDFITKTDEERFFIQNVIPYPIAKVDNKGNKIETNGMSLEEILEFTYNNDWCKKGTIGTKGDDVKYDLYKFGAILRLFGFTTNWNNDIIHINNSGEWRRNPGVSQWLMRTMTYLYNYNKQNGGVKIFRKLFDTSHWNNKRIDEYKHIIRISNEQWTQNLINGEEPGHYQRIEVRKINRTGGDFGYKMVEVDVSYRQGEPKDGFLYKYNEDIDVEDLEFTIRQMVKNHIKYSKGYISNKTICESLGVFFPDDKVTKNQILQMFDQIILSMDYISTDKRNKKGRGRLISPRKQVTIDEREVGSLTLYESLEVEV